MSVTCSTDSCPRPRPGSAFGSHIIRYPPSGSYDRYREMVCVSMRSDCPSRATGLCCDSVTTAKMPCSCGGIFIFPHSSSIACCSCPLTTSLPSRRSIVLLTTVSGEREVTVSSQTCFDCFLLGRWQPMPRVTATINSDPANVIRLVIIIMSLGNYRCCPQIAPLTAWTALGWAGPQSSRRRPCCLSW